MDEGERGERVVVMRQNVAVCSGTGQVVAALSAPVPAAQIKCRYGHWTWEDGNFCGQCGTSLAAPPSPEPEP